MMTSRALLLLTTVLAVPAAGDDTAERLREAMASRLAEPLYANVDVAVHVTTTDGRTLYERDPDTLYIPASAAKIFPSAVALALLGPDHRIATPLLTDGKVVDGVLEGLAHRTAVAGARESDTAEIGLTDLGGRGGENGLRIHESWGELGQDRTSVAPRESDCTQHGPHHEAS